MKFPQPCAAKAVSCHAYKEYALLLLLVAVHTTKKWRQIRPKETPRYAGRLHSIFGTLTLRFIVAS